MAPKSKSRLVDQPPSASSSEEHEQVEESHEEEQEEEEEQSEEQEEDSGEETEDDEPKTAPQKPIQTPQKPQSSSESGTDNGSGSESESESGQTQPSPSVSDFTVKPSVPAIAAAPSKPVAVKRPQETQKEKESRRKKPKIVEEEEKKSAVTPRSLWSDEDQVALLKGMVEYKEQKGTEPNADMSAFHDFIKGKLHAEVSKSQLRDKLRRLKKKFLTNMKDGEDPSFVKGQDFLVFQHSKMIWGAPSVKIDAGTSNGVKENVNNSTNGKAKKTVAVKKSSEPKKTAKISTLTKPKVDEKHKEEEKQIAVKEVVKEDIVKADKQDFQSKYPNLAASFESVAGMSSIYPNAASYLKEHMSLIASDKAKVLDEKWKKLLDDEAALMGKRLDLIAEHYNLVIGATRGN